MREIALLKLLSTSYHRLNLSYSRLVMVFALMLFAAILEMVGLSIIYPLVLALQNREESLHVLFSYSPFSRPLLHDVKTQVLILFCGAAVANVAKNASLYFGYQYNIAFATYYHRSLIRGLYSAYVHKSLLEFRRESAGSLGNIVCVQSRRLIDGIVRPLLVMVTEGVLLVAILVLICLVSPWLSMVVILACGGAAGLYHVLFRGKALRWGRQRMQAASTLLELVNNTAEGIGEIKVFGKEGYLTSRVYSAAAMETDMFRNLEMHQQGPRLLIEAVFVLALASCFSLFVLIGTDLTEILATFSVVAAASLRVLPSINRLVSSYSNFSFEVGPALSLMETISADDLMSRSRAGNGTDRNRTRLSGKLIELRNVSFEYPLVNKPVLRDVNWAIRMGERVGIVGSSGSGKSTLIEVLAGLCPPTTGLVVVDGQPVSADLRAWQAIIGYVPQVPFIMPGPIRENVAFQGDGAGNDDEVWGALEKVGLSTFVSALPKGIDTEIGEKGVELSGGQKQLVCVARALFRRPKVLVLDEPTAALDAESEQMVLEAITGLRDTTVVMASHKRHNFRDFDAVYVCEHRILRLHQSFRRERSVDGQTTAEEQ